MKVFDCCYLLLDGDRACFLERRQFKKYIIIIDNHLTYHLITGSLFSGMSIFLFFTNLDFKITTNKVLLVFLLQRFLSSLYLQPQVFSVSVTSSVACLRTVFSLNTRINESSAAKSVKSFQVNQFEKRRRRCFHAAFRLMLPSPHLLTRTRACADTHAHWRAHTYPYTAQANPAN